ncbi:hypothetical protein GCM10011369_13400 [Neiella marina]|uniref:Uncharacterized protein n=1 Tax=Neiella marina TaxID=508461 RepID=A0A8J2XP07_9GAMM|nr:hypothetical protein GCM10011369_13400 [Neiella marina]
MPHNSKIQIKNNLVARARYRTGLTDWLREQLYEDVIVQNADAFKPMRNCRRRFDRLWSATLDH